MSGYQTYNRWKRIEDFADKLGFRLGNPRHGNWGLTPIINWGRGDNDHTDVVSIYPKDNALPVFNPDAEIFSGTFAQLENFLLGWERSQQYDSLLRMTDEKRRKQFEDKERERQRLEQERLEKKKMFAILKDRGQDNGQ